MFHAPKVVGRAERGFFFLAPKSRVGLDEV